MVIFFWMIRNAIYYIRMNQVHRKNLSKGLGYEIQTKYESDQIHSHSSISI